MNYKEIIIAIKKNVRREHMMTRCANTLFDEERLYTEYKKFYKDRKLFSEWQEEVENMAKKVPHERLRDVKKGLEIKRDKIYDLDSGMKDMIYLLIIPISICVVNFFLNIFGQALPIIQFAFNVINNQMDAKVVADKITELMKQFISTEIQLFTNVVIMLLFFIGVSLVIREIVNKSRWRRKKYYIDLIFVLTNITENG